jgi:CHAD domain-containing protein
VLATRRDRQAAGGDWDHSIGAALPALRHERRRVRAWSISKGFSALAPVLEAIYREGRAAMREASRDGSPASYHAWRKRAKDLWYAARLLRKSARRPLAALCNDLRDLSEVLGKLHDLDVFAETVANDPALSADYHTLAATVVGERETLVSTAHRLGVRIYAERPKAFVRRVEAYWAAWRHPSH